MLKTIRLENYLSCYRGTKALTYSIGKENHAYNKVKACKTHIYNIYFRGLYFYTPYFKPFTKLSLFTHNSLPSEWNKSIYFINCLMNKIRIPYISRTHLFNSLLVGYRGDVQKPK